MTLILHRNYGYDLAGISGFLINRALRLYPLYWCILIISCAILVFAAGDTSHAFFPKLRLPDTAGSWLSNISHIYPQWFPASVKSAISPPSWTLTIEWLFYVLMALGLSRSWKSTLLWMLIAISYFIYTYTANLGLTWRYSTLAAGALPFAIGAMLFHIETHMMACQNFLKSNMITIWLSVFFLLNGAICIVAKTEGLFVLTEITFYLNMVINALLIANLSLKQRPLGHLKLHRFDRVLGDLSYPIYLLHLPVAFGVSYYVFGRSERVYDISTIGLILLTLVLSSVLGLILNYYIDRPVRKFRERFRRQPRLP